MNHDPPSGFTALYLKTLNTNADLGLGDIAVD
jgi:hypothetical protein